MVKRFSELRKFALKAESCVHRAPKEQLSENYTPGCGLMGLRNVTPLVAD